MQEWTLQIECGLIQHQAKTWLCRKRNVPKDEVSIRIRVRARGSLAKSRVWRDETVTCDEPAGYVTSL